MLAAPTIGAQTIPPSAPEVTPPFVFDTIRAQGDLAAEEVTKAANDIVYPFGNGIRASSVGQALDTVHEVTKFLGGSPQFAYDTVNNNGLNLAIDVLIALAPQQGNEVKAQRDAVGTMALQALEGLNATLHAQLALAAASYWTTDQTLNATQKQGVEDALKNFNETRAKVSLALLDPIPSLPETLAQSGVAFLTLQYPTPGSWNKSPVEITFRTTVPTSPNGPSFVAHYALAGTGVWQYANHTHCPGTTTRTCTFFWHHALNQDVAIRVGVGNNTACYTAQCAHVSNVHLDTIPPTTRLDSSVPPFQRVGDFELRFKTELHSAIALEYTRDGAAMRLSAGSAIADASGDATATFQPSREPGVYRIYARATDRAGNVETDASNLVATLHVIDSVALTVANTSLYYKNGDTLRIEVCAMRGTAPVVPADQAVLNVSVDAGAPVALSHVTGCTWALDLGTVSGIASLTKRAIVIQAMAGDPQNSPLTGRFAGNVTLTPYRLATITIEREGTVPFVGTGQTATVRIVGRYNDTGALMRDTWVTGTAGTTVLHRNTTSEGSATFSHLRPTTASLNFTFSAVLDKTVGPPAQVTTITAFQTMAWTRLVTTYVSSQHAANNSDVGQPFSATYQLRWEHDLSPAVGASVNLVAADEPTEAFVSVPANAQGLANVTLVNNSLVNKFYAVSAEFDDGQSHFQTPTSWRLRVNFTQAFVHVQTNVTLVNVNASFPVRVNASLLHPGGLSMAGANLTLFADNDPTRPVGNVTLNAFGWGYAFPTMNSTFVGSLSARLASNPQGITSQLAPFASLPITFTELVLDEITVNDTSVSPLESVRFNIHARWATNGSTETLNATLILIPTVGTPATCTMVEGISLCDVSRPFVYSGGFRVSILTQAPEFISTIRGGNPTTPPVNWTYVSVTQDPPARTLGDVDGPIHVPVRARYEHDLTAGVAGAVIAGRDASGATLGSCTTASDGRCTLSLVSTTVRSATLTINVTSAPSDVTKTNGTLSTPVLTWTRLLLDWTSDTAPFATGTGANYRVGVRFAHNGSVASDALVSIAGLTGGAQSNLTDASGETHVEAIESAAGTRAVTVRATHPGLGLSANVSSTGANKTADLRWTAIGFRHYTYDPQPQSTNAQGEPVWPVNTAVRVCAVAATADTNATLPGAEFALRGILLTADGGGQGCITLAQSPAARTVTVTAHGETATIDGRTITSSVDRRVTLHFVAS